MNALQKWTLLAFGLAGFVALSLVAKAVSPRVNAEEPTPYTVTLTSEDPFVVEGAGYGVGIKTVRYTTFEYYQVKNSTGYHTELYPGYGYIGNDSTSPITSITSIVASFTGNASIQTAYSYSSWLNSGTTIYPSTPVTFTDNPYYFRLISTNYSTPVVLTSLTVSYSCLPTPPTPTFTLEDDHYVVTGYKKNPSTIIIPATYNGLPVTKIGPNAFRNATSITSITLPSSITEIGAGAFYNCQAVTAITLPDIPVIGDQTFFGCSSLSSITIPSTVISIGLEAFNSCVSLTTITIPSSVTSIGERAFNECSNLTTLNGGGSLTAIGGSAFAKTAWLADQQNSDSDKVIIFQNILVNGTSATGSLAGLAAESFTYISPDAFSYATITDVTLPSTVAEIGNQAFYGCSNLTSINLPSSLITMGDAVFQWCGSLATVTNNSASLTTLGGYAFQGCTALTSLSFATGLTTIGDSAFDSCSNLATISIPTTVTSIGASAFSGTAWLTAQQNADPLVIINGAILVDGTAVTVTALTVPSGVTTIIPRGFESNYYIQSVSLPAGFTSLGDYAFYDCNALTTVNLPSGITSIGSNAFNSCSVLATINLPESLLTIGEAAFTFCTALNGVAFPSGLTRIEDSLFNACSALHSITIPNGVTYIGMNAFAYCTSLPSLIIPEGVTTLGTGFVQECNVLSALVIPSTVQRIQNFSFQNCSSLHTIYYGGTSSAQWTALPKDQYAFLNVTILNVYCYSATESVGYWRFSSGLPVLW
ncbi:MAG: leucine-rich repeat domain-containing protein [Bacilli bacterium]|jgi:hypothetical protein